VSLHSRTLSKNKYLRETLTTLRAAGIEPEISQNKHTKFTWHDVMGHKRILIVAISPSDWRSVRNAQARLRRMLSGRPA
jgi:hypothetical protein